MPNLIIGHVDHQSARIWVRGDKTHPVAHLDVTSANGPGPKPTPIALEERHFFTGVFELTGLQADRQYTCKVRFKGTKANSKTMTPKIGALHNSRAR